MSSQALADTKPDLEPVRQDAVAGCPSHVVDVAARTHVGKVRPNNEDNFHVVQFGRYLRTMLSSLPTGQVPDEEDRPGYGFVVADGMGGRSEERRVGTGGRRWRRAGA